MINKTLFSGLNLESNNFKYVNDFAGLNFQSNNFKYVNDFAGIDFTSEYTFTLITRNAEDPQNTLVVPYFEIKNIDFPNDVFSNGLANAPSDTFKFKVKPGSHLQITLKKTGFQDITYNIQYQLNQDYYRFYYNGEPSEDLYMFPNVVLPLTCDSFLTNETGLKIDGIIKGQKNYITCNFGISDFQNESEYFIAFTQFKNETNKFNGRELVPIYMGLVGANLYQWRAEITNPQDGYYFTSLLRKKL